MGGNTVLFHYCAIATYYYTYYTPFFGFGQGVLGE